MGNLKSAHNHLTPGACRKSLVWRHKIEPEHRHVPSSQEGPLSVNQKQRPNVATKDAKIWSQDHGAIPLSFSHTWSIISLRNLWNSASWEKLLKALYGRKTVAFQSHISPSIYGYTCMCYDLLLYIIRLKLSQLIRSWQLFEQHAGCPNTQSTSKGNVNVSANHIAMLSE